MRHELLTREELADRFGVDVRSITNWTQAGMPQRKKSGRPVYSWPECRDWREQQIREDARATRHADGNPDRKEQAAEARLRMTLAEAERAELELAKLRGELVPVDYMRSEFDRIATALRGRLLSMPQAWSARLVACRSPVDAQLALQDAVNELMPMLRELADDDGETADEAPAGRQDGAA